MKKTYVNRKIGESKYRLVTANNKVNYNLTENGATFDNGLTYNGDWYYANEPIDETEASHILGYETPKDMSAFKNEVDEEIVNGLDFVDLSDINDMNPQVDEDVVMDDVADDDELVDYDEYMNESTEDVSDDIDEASDDMPQDDEDDEDVFADVDADDAECCDGDDCCEDGECESKEKVAKVNRIIKKIIG